MRLISRFNEQLATTATLVFGTVWAFYALMLYGLLPLLFPGAITTLLYWSNVIQLVALPLLAVGANVLGRAAEKRAIETHDTVIAELKLAQQERDQLAALIADLHVGLLPHLHPDAPNPGGDA